MQGGLLGLWISNVVLAVNTMPKLALLNSSKHAELVAYMCTELQLQGLVPCNCHAIAALTGLNSTLMHATCMNHMHLTTTAVQLMGSRPPQITCKQVPT